MSAATASDIRSGIGARLKAGRERMGLTLLQVAERLHVDAKVLESLEVDRFEDLGATVYVRGHIKRYSELVSENGVELLAHYSAITKPVMPDLTQLPKAARHADPRKLVLPSLVVLIGFALVGTVWWVLQNIERTPSAVPQAVPETTDLDGTAASGDAGGDSIAPTDSAPAVASAPSVQQPGGAQASSAAQAANTRQSASAGQSPSGTSPSSASARNAPAAAAGSRSGTTPTATAKPTPKVVGTPPPKAGTTAGAASSAQISKASLARAAAAAKAADTARARAVNVTLKFATDGWAEVYDANGQRLFYDIGSANSSHALSGTPPLRVVLGNAPGVSLSINGKSAKVPASVMQDSGAQFTINRSGRIVRTRPDGG